MIMIRIVGVILPDAKRAEVGLTQIYGIGQSSARRILQTAHIDIDRRVKDLTIEESELIRSIIEKKFKVEGELRSQINQNIRHYREVGCYRGLRHIRNLPVRGQRTKTNARTKRGKRVTVGSGRKKSAEKT